MRSWWPIDTPILTVPRLPRPAPPVTEDEAAAHPGVSWGIRAWKEATNSSRETRPSWQMSRRRIHAKTLVIVGWVLVVFVGRQGTRRARRGGLLVSCSSGRTTKTLVYRNGC